MTSPSLEIEQEKLTTSSNVLRALAHPLRLDLVRYIRTQGWVTVQAIYQALNIEQSLTSQHLRVLRMAGLVTTERQGKYVNYHVNEDKYQQVQQSVARFLQATEKESETFS